MKKSLLLGISILATCALLAGPASAADPVDPVIFADPVAGHDWSGPYAGLHAGWGWGNSDWLFTNSGLPTSPNIDGFVGGGHLGWNWQNGVWVFGVLKATSTFLISVARTRAPILHSPVSWTSTGSPASAAAWV